MVYDYNVNENGCFRLYAEKGTDFSKGYEIFFSYGFRNNETFLEEYGFATLDNLADQVRNAEQPFSLLTELKNLNLTIGWYDV